MKFLSRYFTNLHPLQRKEKRCEGLRWVGPAIEEALCPCCSSSFPSPATLLLMNTSNMEGQAFSKPSQGQFSASWWGETGCEYSLWHGKPGPQGVVEEKAGRSGLSEVYGVCISPQVLQVRGPSHPTRLCSVCPCLVSLKLSVPVPFTMRKGPGEDLSRTSSP